VQRDVFLSKSAFAVEHTRLSQSLPECPGLHLQIALLFFSTHFPFPLQMVPFLSLGHASEQVAPAKSLWHLHNAAPLFSPHFPCPLQILPFDRGQVFSHDRPIYPSLQSHFGFPFAKVHSPRRLQISAFLLVGQGKEQSLPSQPFLHMHFIPPFFDSTHSPFALHGLLSPFLKGQDSSQVRPP